MSSRDVRDMLGLSAEQQHAQPRPKKKAKTSQKRPEGITRELFALIGERAPPIPIGPATKKYKAAPGKTPLNSRWSMTTFSHQARADGLTFKHWLRELPGAPAPAEQKDGQTEEQKGEAQAESKEQEGEKPAENAETKHEETKEQPAARAAAQTPADQEYPFAKYNQGVKAPTYTEQDYTSHLENPDWTKDETDYLMSLYNDFYGKWPVIWDRYEFSSSNSDADPPTRSLEQLKARFYHISAKVMELRTPVSNMTAAEFADHEKMVKFNPDIETRRKRGREALMLRNADEVKEERYLLDELRRIYCHQERFASQLKELRERLDHGLTDDKAGGASFTTHAEITALFQRVLANDRNRKQRRPTLEGQPSIANSPVTVGPNGTPTSATAAQKRNSTAQSSGPSHRQLTSRSEARWGVSTHDRLSSGVTFRSDKLNKLRQAKSQVQTNKIRDVLNEIDVPEYLQMPTVAVCEAMERLVGKVNLLLDARKMREKEDNEILVAKQQKDNTTGGPTAKTEAQADGDNSKLEDENTEMDGEGETQLNDTTVQDDEDEEGDDDGDEDRDEDQDEEEEEGEEEDDDNEGEEGDGERDEEDEEEEEEDEEEEGQNDGDNGEEQDDEDNDNDDDESRPGTRNGKRDASAMSDGEEPENKKSRKS